MIEEYWSLQKLTQDVFYNLKNHYEVLSVFLIKDLSINQKNIDNLYDNCDIIVYIASKLFNFKRLSEKPTVFFTHAWMDHGAGINLYVNEELLQKNDILVFTSSSALNKFNQVYETNIKTRVFPYYTDISEIILSKSEKEIRLKYDLPAKSKILIYFGRLTPEKNIESLFELAKKNEDQDFIILIVGTFGNISTFGFGNIDLESYASIIKEKSLKDNSGKIRLINSLPRQELAELISISYLTINPSLCLEEDFGLSVVESMAIGVPVIASNWGGFKDIITSGEDGFLVKTFFTENNKVQNDIEEMEFFINTLLINEKKHNEFSCKAKEKYQKLFSPISFITNFELLLDEINLKNINVDKIFYPKEKYLTLYKRTLENRAAKNIYLDNEWLFKDLYKYYL